MRTASHSRAYTRHSVKVSHKYIVPALLKIVEWFVNNYVPSKLDTYIYTWTRNRTVHEGHWPMGSWKLCTFNGLFCNVCMPSEISPESSWKISVSLHWKVLLCAIQCTWAGLKSVLNRQGKLALAYTERFCFVPFNALGPVWNQSWIVRENQR